MYRVIQIDLFRWGVYEMLAGGRLKLRFSFQSEAYARLVARTLDHATRTAARTLGECQ